jgi:cytidyltransferase-like protein
VTVPKENAATTGLRRVYLDMVGDLFHAGHVNLLRAAREFGDWVIVGVLDDEVVASYKRRPIMTLDERVTVIAACRYVDQVIPRAPDVMTKDFLDAYDIGLVLHGDDASPEVCQAQYGAAMREGKLRLVRYTAGISTTDLINRVLARR